MKLFAIFLLSNLILLGSAFAIVELDFGHTKYIAAVLETEAGIEVWINTRKFWNEEKTLIGSYSEEEAAEVEKIVEKSNLCNLAESQYEPCRPVKNLKVVEIALMRAGIEIDSKFQSWAEKEIRK